MSLATPTATHTQSHMSPSHVTHTCTHLNMYVHSAQHKPSMYILADRLSAE